MNDSKPTPGPWKWDHGTLRAPGMPGRHVVLNTFDDDDLFLHGPDKNLIAAAPDLLAACELVAETLWSRNVATIIGEQVRAAIKKAKGGP